MPKAVQSRRELVKSIKQAAAIAKPYRISRADRWTGELKNVGCYDAKNFRGLQVRIPADVGWIWVKINESDLIAPRA